MNRYKIKMKNIKIKRVECIKFLGVMLDDRLNFDRHALNICAKVAQAVGIMNRVANHLSLSQLVELYYKIVYPHLTYCVTV